jgi:hypothetical protein
VSSTASPRRSSIGYAVASLRTPYPDQEYVVRRCLKVVLKEEAEHHRHAVRDLAELEASGTS